MFWGESYGTTFSEERKREETNLRFLWKQLQKIQQLDPHPLSHSRPPQKRLIGNCRDYSTFLNAILRYQGVPARARCGFATYFQPDHYEDHWVCEYWHDQQERWVMVDAQLDPLQREKLGIAFDTFDLPQGQFLFGGEAWQLYREGKPIQESSEYTI